MAQCRYYLKTLGPNVGIIYRHGAPGYVDGIAVLVSDLEAGPCFGI